MLRTIVGAMLACCVLGAQAAPIVYSSSQFQTDAVAVAGSTADVQSAMSPPGSLPLISSAVVNPGADFAAAFGFAANGLLVTQAEASGPGQTSSVASAEFTGGFSLSQETTLKFFIDLIDEDFTDPGAFSDASLFLLLTFEGMTYADRVFSGSDSIFFTVDLPGAGRGLLSLLLTSEANAAGGASAANFAQASFLVVPAPGTLALLLAGVGVLGWVNRRRQAATR